MADNILVMDDHRPQQTLVIDTGDNKLHVVPVAYFEAWLRGEDVAPISESMLRAVVSEWLGLVTQQAREDA